MLTLLPFDVAPFEVPVRIALFCMSGVFAGEGGADVRSFVELFTGDGPEPDIMVRRVIE